MRFRYRFVDFGTNFTSIQGNRDKEDQESDHLFENELVLDVGGRCWGIAGCSIPIIDHHYHRDYGGQFPSASSAVLHKAETIVKHFQDMEDVWFVTHRIPDFDAFCAMYLDRRNLESTTNMPRIPYNMWESYGLKKEGWFNSKNEINWFSPDVSELPDERYWPIVLASYASCIDNGRRLKCPRVHALHSILYAAIHRGRNYTSESDGAVEFFDEVVRQIGALGSEHISNTRKHPFFDAVLQKSTIFVLEQELLKQEEVVYGQDIRRARKSIVFIQQSTTPFKDWFPNIQSKPLLTPSGEVSSEHLGPSDHTRIPVDGLYIRDPACMLFKEWARLDIDNSSNGQGFLFTAIAFTNQKSDAPVNSSEYFFSLDPERAGDCHLYSVWARLQQHEALTLQQPYNSILHSMIKSNNGVHNRPGFEKRAGNDTSVFDDPWFDGHNYQATIVVTPNRGSLIGPPGNSSDLSDDPVVKIVQSELEMSIFRSDVVIEDFATEASDSLCIRHSLPINEATILSPPIKYKSLRYATIELETDFDLLSNDVSKQIGEHLWRIIDTDHSRGIPTDFTERHLRWDENMIAVWSRRGIAIAFIPSAINSIDEVRPLLSKVAELSRETLSILGEPHLNISDSSYSSSSHSVLTKAFSNGIESAVREVMRLQHKLSATNGGIVREFFKSSGISTSISIADHLCHDEHQRQHSISISENTRILSNAQRVAEVLEYMLVSVSFQNSGIMPGGQVAVRILIPLSEKFLSQT
ncbi:MAG: hypothetical protein R3C11_29545 [Planctomycetaceae bacterium]